MAGEELDVGRKGHVNMDVPWEYLKSCLEITLVLSSAGGGIKTYESIRQVENSIFKSDCERKP